MTELLLGFSIGLGAGISPGPLLTLVVTTTLQRGFAAGTRVACSPLLTDGPIIAVVLLFLSSVPDIVVRLLAAAGGLFVIYLGVETVRTAAKATLTTVNSSAPQRDLWQGVVVNVLSPHPWLFWLSVGGPIVVDAWHDMPHMRWRSSSVSTSALSAPRSRSPALPPSVAAAFPTIGTVASSLALGRCWL